MIPALVQNLGGAFSKTAGTTISVTFVANASAGNLIVCRVLFDNAATASKPIVSSIAKDPAETNNWLFLGAARSTSTSAGAFSSGEVWCIQTTVPWNSFVGTVTLDTSVTMRSSTYMEFSGAQAVLRSTVGTAYSTTTTAASATTTGTTPQTNDLALGMLFGSNVAVVQAGSNNTTGGTWSTVYGFGSTGSTTATNNYGLHQFKVLTSGSHQTYANSAAMTAGNGAVIAILQSIPDPAITQEAYRFYSDGTESGSAPLAGQSNGCILETTTQDVNFVIRVRLASTTSDPVPSTFDFKIQYENAGVGDWTDFIGYDSPNITEGQATTNRLTGGTGTFVAGKVAEDGIADNVGWTGNNYTELVFPVTLRAADFAIGGYTLKARVLCNGSTSLMTYTSYPTINYYKYAPAVLIDQKAYRFYEDGTESGSTALAAQNTACTVNLATSDANIQLRTLLQSDGDTVSTDDYQLQWEKNSSGTWTNVIPYAAEAMLDTYAEANRSANVAIYGTQPAVGQSFLADGKQISKLRVMIRRVGAPVGNMNAGLFLATGTFGDVGNLPTGMKLASSTTLLDCSVPPTGSYPWYDFVFGESPVMTNGASYFAVIETTNTLTSTDNNGVGFDNTAATHAGRGTAMNGSGVWTTTSSDMVFELYTKSFTPAGHASANVTDGGATTNRLTGGTGTFQAGKVSEDGIADNIGWTGANYTELLFPLTISKDEYADGDTIRFRVLYNNLTTSMVFTQTPLINISKAAATTGYVDYWDGDEWLKKPAKYWNGTAWVQKPVKRWSGSAWELST